MTLGKNVDDHTRFPIVHTTDYNTPGLNDSGHVSIFIQRNSYAGSFDQFHFLPIVDRKDG